MKKLIAHIGEDVVITHNDLVHSFKRSGGTLLVPGDKAGELPEGMVLILILLAGAGFFYLQKDSYYLLRERVWTFLDRKNGGLNVAGMQVYSDDEAVQEAAELNRQAFARRTNKQ